MPAPGPVGTDDICETAHTVTARRDHRCTGWRCATTICPGEQYVRHVLFPGHDAHGGHAPAVLPLCQTCATAHGRPMPPRRGETKDERTS